ncbi:hypothetical protein BaRGS_00002659 [Batillaria attramentaria]|uniref:Secreted protein n=1 Tax=Batillaria attramentaria TaxID=370345 RepID=A0ABD0M2J2_9CAEN
MIQQFIYPSQLLLAAALEARRELRQSSSCDESSPCDELSQCCVSSGRRRRRMIWFAFPSAGGHSTGATGPSGTCRPLGDAGDGTSVVENHHTVM